MSVTQLARTLAVILSLCFCASTFAQAPAKDPERQKAKIVSRTYQMTYGSVEMCKQATPAAAAEFQTELNRFVKQNAVFMKQVTESPHYAKAREQYAHHEKLDPARDTPEKLAGKCQYLAELLRSMLDTPDGRQVVKDFEETLSK